MKWIKYYLIVMQSIVSNKTVVNFFGSSYIISGNIVKRIK
jgi:hypothetical protein